MIETLVSIKHLEDFSEQGFYSKTYIAEDERLNRRVAVKDIFSEAIESKEAIENYFKEAQRLSLAAHPRVLPVYFVGVDSSTEGVGSPRIVTKFMKNGTLSGLLERVYHSGHTLDLGAAIRYAHDIIQGMIHLHSLGILHLDLKASNILIGDDGKLVISDFGQSQMLNEEAVNEMGDLYPSLLTPEGIRKKVGGKSTDIYQFGVLLYSLFNYDIYREALGNDYKVSTEILRSLFRTGETVDEEKLVEFKDNMKRLSKDIRAGVFPNRERHHYCVPKIVQDVITKCLEPAVENRFENFYEIQHELNKLSITNEALQFRQKLECGTITFTKSNISCEISVEEVSGRYKTRAKKNNRASNSFNAEGLTRIQLARKVEEIVNGI